jgi:dTDP-4-amino-4,6-dideoxygalactose transaminase
MLTTTNPKYNELFRLWRQHSMNVPDTVRHGSNRVIFESYSTLGYNYRMTDIQAAVGREQLKRLPEIVIRRRELAADYGKLLAGIPGLQLAVEPAWARSNWQSFWVRLDQGIDQHAIMQKMLDAGVSTRRGIMCAHREPAYKQEPWRYGHPSGLTESEQAQDHCLILPLFHQMTAEEQLHVVSALNEAVDSQSSVASASAIA